MHWFLSHRADPRAKPLADRHYNRQNPNSPQFVPPGKCVVLLTEHADALWVTLAPYAQYVRHQWAGAWTCTMFRNEGLILSSELIRDAVAATLAALGTPPDLGFLTFVDRNKTKPKRDPGYCYLKAGWRPIGRSKKGLYALGLAVCDFPMAEAARQRQDQLTLLNDRGNA